MSSEHALLVAGTSDALRTISQSIGGATVQTEVVTEPNLTVAIPVAVSITSASAVVVAASTGIRHIVIAIPSSADTGAHFNVNAAATTSHFLCEAGGTLKFNTAQEIRAIRAGSANVTAYVMTGVIP